ncbi:hypothetical protein HNQ68_002284 [Pseudochrobactrum saccharolyticum]|uniref:Uncharacterized protein n=1 Tax=Pseudochrobactrum saccharolyticum TaxID=354352 RepID=A0A7W8AJX5_9HYPH|nr:hypothetical protein [Pseudochrobactrum saccharolyticum]KAB0538461.1 hypothetical protein F7P81_12265 [Pseudochrobactrum saccharolyticum]MBB5091743.1 hypothetical protein [Pseudochrobactrum saccharolyticum]
MAQFFMGYKPGVGQVLKVLKYNDDDALTLANTAYDRYLFNSETQKLAYIRDQWTASFNYHNLSNGQVNDYEGTSSTGKYAAYTIKYGGSIHLTNTNIYARYNNIFKDISYVPMVEARIFEPDGRVYCAQRVLHWISDSLNNESAVIGTSQFGSAWFKPSMYGGTGDWIRRTNNSLSYMGLDSWLCWIGGAPAPNDANRPGVIATNSDGPVEKKVIVAYWDLPADSSPMTTYPHVQGLEALRWNRQEFILSRPGYSVDSSAGTRHRIIDSSLNLASIIMAGETTTIGTGGSVVLPVPYGFKLSPDAIVDMMIRLQGQPQYIPPHMLGGYVRNNYINVSYKVHEQSVEIFNESSEPVIVTYMVSNIDFSARSTGGREILYKGHDGQQYFIQIKKPGTSDPASRANDVMMDSRLPMIQIVKEGYIPFDQFSSGAAENTMLFGAQAHELNFENNGFIPFLKYSLVFSDRIMPPAMAIYYSYTSSGGPQYGPPSNHSSLARLENNKVKFWMNKGAWSAKFWSNSSGSERTDYYGDPLGIRYYVLGIARP